MASRKTHCIHGHEIAVVGRTKARDCRECERKRKRAANMTPEQRERQRERCWRYDNISFDGEQRRLRSRRKARLAAYQQREQEEQYA